MKPGFFIDRPVLSMVLSILIVIVGIIGLVLLPVEQYPQITPPVVKIGASYSGANATTVSQAVATPIEQELNGTPGMIYMESSSSNSGGLSITVTFDVNTNADLAAVEVQNRVKLAESRLPAEVLQNGISVEKQAPGQLMTIALVSDDPKYDEIYLSNYATINILDIIRRIPGVGRVSNVGSRYYGMQIWVYPDKMASFGLTIEDLQNALKDQNRESAAGELGKQPIIDVDVTIPITAQGRLSSVEEFEDIVVRAGSRGGFYLDDHDRLLRDMDADPGPKILFGVSHALLDLAETRAPKLHNTIVMETGGMKGRREEIAKGEFHCILCEAFGVEEIHSEYGMAELSSQAYSEGQNLFRTPPWMRVGVRDLNDPFDILAPGQNGGVNIIDLANIYSCAFIQTQDVGVTFPDEAGRFSRLFSIHGRADRSEIRGCNLLVQ